MKIIVLDTETISVEKPFCYNVGYCIYDTETEQKVAAKDFVVEQVWHNPMLFSTAYYADKRQIYVSRMRARKCTMDKWGYIMHEMRRDIIAHEVAHGFAYNSNFDEGVFKFNCEWFKTINPLDTVQIHDIRGHVHRYMAFTPQFQEYCNQYQRFTESGNYSTTAETVFQYITQDHEFVEEHTALADSLIELEILRQCVTQGGEWAADYKVYQTIPRNLLRTYKVVDADGEIHEFPYTNRRKMTNNEGMRLYIKATKPAEQ